MPGTEVADLTPYSHKPLTHQNALRLIKLRPANYSQTGIDCDLIESRIIGEDSPKPDLPPPEAYEAVSWCWGDQKRERSLRIHNADQAFRFGISPNLESALRAFRKEDVARTLWVDAICIDQENTEERNEQVPKMNRIYGQAKNVCIWVGDEYEESHMAIEFISSKVLSLWEFDDLCENLRIARQWGALVKLMKRPWFSRRWVVQEIALAARGTLYCGRDYIDWQDFADAISLFVEVESSTHRLSEIMKKDAISENIPDFFGNVPALGAALLVDATSNLFRSSKIGRPEPLSSLEHLVSKYSVFEASQPRDTIYALLAIARDTSPQAKEQGPPLPDLLEIQQQLAGWGRRNIRSEVYRVDYRLPVVDVYKDFIDFSIRRSDPTKALDIICRPWAPPVKRSDDQVEPSPRASGVPVFDVQNTAHQREMSQEIPLPSWIPDRRSAAFTMNQHPKAGWRMDRGNADPLVGIPNLGQRDYSAAGTRSVTSAKLKFKKRTRFYSMFVEGFILDEVGKIEEPSRLGNIPWKWLKPGGWHDTDEDPPQEFWRTLVADRGQNGRNPPTYYPRACKESIKKSPPGGTIDTKLLINEGRCTIVAEFLRRVQAVIWNRCLMRTKAGRLALVHENAEVGDFICILYGCSVPVVLHRKQKTDEDMERELAEDHEEEYSAKTKEAVEWVEAIRLRQLYRKRTRAKKILEQKENANNQRFWAFARFWGQENSTKDQLLNRSQSHDHKAKLWAHWTYLRLALLVAVAVYVEGWLHRTLEAALIANSSVLLYPQLASPVQARSPNLGIFGSRLRKPLKYLRLTWFILATVRIGFWSQLTLENLLLAVSLVTVFPEFLVSTSQLQFASSSAWGKLSRAVALPKLPVTSNESPRYYWILIGECYVHGMMDGEAITFQNDKKIKPQIFELR